MIENAIQWWRTLALRERRLVSLGAAVLVLALVYLLAFEPAWRGRARAAEQIPALRSQLAQLDELAAEARRLSALPSGSEPVQAVRKQLEDTLRVAGLSPYVAQVSLSGELFDVRLRNVPFAPFLAWLESAQRQTRLRIVDAAVQREAGGGAVTARVALETARREGG